MQLLAAVDHSLLLVDTCARRARATQLQQTLRRLTLGSRHRNGHSQDQLFWLVTHITSRFFRLF